MELVVIGGGLAGTTVAILAARAGRRVSLVEKDDFPRDKLCGEFLSPEACLTLRRLGVEAEVEALQPPRLARAWFTEGSGQQADVPLPAPGLGVSRLSLDAILHRAALDAGVRWLRGEAERVEDRGGRLEVEIATETGPTRVRADLAVGAWGRHGRLDNRLGRRREPRRFVGIKRHHLGPAGDRVEIHAFTGGYCGVNAVDGGRVNVCALVDRRWLKSAEDRGWEGISRRFADANPHLAQRLGALRPDPDRPMLTVAGIDFGRREPLFGALVMVGDGAAMIAPLAGDGQAMALRGGEALAELLIGSCDIAEIRRAWQARFRAGFDRRLGIGRRLQDALLDPRIAPWLLRSSRWFPALPAWLAKQTREVIQP
jgi:menaquinone-9 beta-reductase